MKGRWSLKRFLALMLAIVLMTASLPEFTVYATEQQPENQTEQITEKSEEDNTKEETPEDPEGDDTKKETPEDPEGDDTKKETPEDPEGDDTKEETPEDPEGDDTKEETPEDPEGDDTKKETPEDSENDDQEQDTTEGNQQQSLLLFRSPDTQETAEEVETGLWSFQVHYSGETDNYAVSKTEDFNLKYQMEFHNSRDILAGEIEIRIPAKLMEDRNGNAILPTEIAVPQGRPEEYAESRVTSFNYYLDEETGELVFFNYQDIASGTNVAWQVSYKNVDVMQITDGSTWSLTPKITVKGDYPEGEEEWTEAIPLTGDVDTCVNLTRVKKEAYSIPGKSYSPGLYTEKQIEQFIAGELPEKYAGDNFESYKYVLWRIEAAGEATQMWSLSLTDRSIVGETPGEIVGFSQKPIEETVLENDEISYTFIKDSTARTIAFEDGELFVVIAYPKDSVSEETLLTNEVTVSINPADGLDEVQTQSADAAWSYIDYDWDPEGGKTCEIRKSENLTYKGWLEVYKGRRAQEVDAGDFPFEVNSWSNQGYGLTHNLDRDAGPYGMRLEGTKVRLTTADDFMYLYDSQTAEETLLTALDYYYSQVSITVEEHGYDPYEEEVIAPDEESGFSVYVMYGRDENGELLSKEEAEKALTDSSGWEKIADIPWDESGTMVYTFTEEQLAREPWRVKIVHETANFFTESRIDVKVRLRYDSEVLGEVLENRDESQEITLTNLSALVAELTTDDGETWKYYQEDDGTEGNMYEKEGLRENSLLLYDIEGEHYPDRSNATATLSSISQKAEATKTVSSRNDTQNGVVRLTYTLTAYDGYEAYDSEVVSALKESGVESPGRSDVVFYDLLPYGVRFDPSAEIKAGRITNFKGTAYKTTSRAWDGSQVTVTVNMDEIDDNYLGTGRTMVKFHVHYDGADAAVLSEGMWREGWGVEFGAYYDWKDLSYTNPATNLAAFMPDNNDSRELLGSEGEIYKDDGENEGSEYPVPEEYRIFGPDIDGDGDMEERNVIYAKATNLDDLTTAAQSSVTKLVRAESDAYGIYSKNTVVSLEEGYSYEITVSNASDDIKDIYVFDRLENAAVDRAAAEQGSFESDWWYGTFESVDVTGLTELGIVPVIYYHENRKTAPLPAGTQHPSEVLTEANGWYTLEQWEAAGKTAKDVQAVAVNLSRKADQTEFILKAMESVSFHINMTAPETLTEGINYAYNNPSFYSYNEKTDSEQMVEGNSASVRLEEGKTLEIVKEFAGEVPDAVKNEEFTFKAYYDTSGKEALAYRKYDLYQLTDGEWKLQKGVYATDAAGTFYLHADEKAVFKNVKTDTLLVEEESSIRWETQIDIQDNPAEEKQIRVFTNSYRPLLYIQKELQGYPDRVKEEIAEQSFQMKLETSEDGGVTWEAADGVEYYLVKNIRLDGNEPEIISSGVTDEDGSFSIKGGEILALRPGIVGIMWRVTETEPGEDWVCMEPSGGTLEGTLPAQGTSLKVVNNYKYKDIYLTKSITHQEAEDCKEAFSFEITTGEGIGERPLAGAEWILLENGGETGVSGVTDENGQFTVDPTDVTNGSASWADKKILIRGVESGTVFTIRETESGEDYRPVNDTVSGKTPLYASSVDVDITNDYLRRPVSVTKQLIYDPEGMTEEQINAAKAKEFTMTITVDGEPYADQPYTVTSTGGETEENTTSADGEFTIGDGQTVTFENAGHAGTRFKIHEVQDKDYPQIYPLDEAGNVMDVEDVIGVEGSEALLINGEKGILLVGKQYVTAEGDNGNGAAYVERIKADSSVRASEAVTLTLEIYDEESKGWTEWPNEDTTINILDTLTGTTEEMQINKGEKLILEPWKLAVLTGFSGKTYRLSESAEDQYRLYHASEKLENAAGFLEISQQEPENAQALTGTTEAQPYGVIYNQVKGIDEQSAVRKWMSYTSDPVPEGAKLVYQVEVFDGQVWSPAENVPYIVTTSSGTFMSKVINTGEDGRITLYQAEAGEGTPVVSFTEHTVVINPSNPTDGTYRIRELLAESDEEWGVLYSYVKEAASVSLNTADASGFVNSNRTISIEIEKAAENAGTQEFTFLLNQVIRTDGTVITSQEQILETIPGEGLAYEVYDSENNQYVSSGITGTKGEIYLKGGQYARLELPEDSRWTVQEKQDTTYVLKELSSEEKKTTKLADNLMLIDSSIEIGTTTLTQTDVQNGVYDAVTGQKVILNTGDVVIPEVIRRSLDGEALRVTSIGVSAFYNCSSLTGITIPESVTSVGNYAFDGCSSLTEITIPEGVTSIGVYAFGGCNSLTEITLPESITSIRSSTFVSCSSLREITIPESVTSIGGYAFQSCSSLTEITIPEGVTSIGSSAFYDCSSLREITIPEGVTSIGGYTFYGCSSLTEITIPESVTSIGGSAFRSCSSLTEITIPEGVTIIGVSAFQECTGLTSIEIPESVTSIAGGAFQRCSSLTEIMIPESVTSIGGYAFNACDNLREITIPESVTSIGGYAFNGCSSLTEITIPESVTSIGEGAFQFCRSLTEITIPEGVTSIGSHTFDKCSSLTGITIPESVTSIGGYAFQSCSSLTEITIPEGVTSIGDYAFNGCRSLTEITIPEGVTIIGSRVFYGCSSLTEITIPEGVTSIGSSAFAGCSSLTEITIPEGVTSIGDYAFNGCSSLTEITIPESVTSIGEGAFQRCINLREITIPESVTIIGGSAFYGCNSLRKITIPEGVTSIGDNAFFYCSNLTEITIPESVTSIGSNAFNRCSSLREITIPEGVTSIGDSAFFYCSRLTTIYIKKSENAISGSPWDAPNATVIWDAQ